MPAFAGSPSPDPVVSPSPDPVPTGPSPDPDPNAPTPQPKPKPRHVVHHAPVQTPAPVVHHTPAPVTHVTPRPAPVVVAPAPRVHHVVHHHRAVHHHKARVHHAAKKHVVHKAKPKTTPAVDPGDQTEVAATPINAVRVAATTPLKAAGSDSSKDEGKALLLAACALLLVAVAGASTLRLAVRAGNAGTHRPL